MWACEHVTPLPTLQHTWKYRSSSAISPELANKVDAKEKLGCPWSLALS